MKDTEKNFENICKKLKDTIELKDKIVNKYAVDSCRSYKMYFSDLLDKEIYKMILDKYEFC